MKESKPIEETAALIQLMTMKNISIHVVDDQLHRDLVIVMQLDKNTN